MNATKLLCAPALLLACAATFAGPSFEATPADVSLQALVGRWAQGEGKKLIWEAGGNAAIKDSAALNADAKLSGAGGFDQALERLNRTLARAQGENPVKALPLKACRFDDAIVIRTIDQPRCGMPL